MKIGAVTIAYNEEETIRGAIRCVKPFVDTQVVLISDRPYFGQGLFEKDKTEQICEEEGVDIVTGFWSLDHFQRNLGNEICQKAGCDWILGIDADEMIDEENLEKLLDFCSKTSFDAVCVNPIMYWNGLDHVLKPRPMHVPVIAMRSNARFEYIRNINVPYTVIDIDYHHFTWSKSKESIYKKVSTYAHAKDVDWESWFHNQFKVWKPGDKVTFPDIPNVVYDVEPYKLPESLRKHLWEYKL